MRLIEEKIDKKWHYLTTIMLLTTNLLVVSVLGYPVVLMFVLLPLWFYWSFGFGFTHRPEIWLFYLIICIIPFINYNDIEDWSEFFKTYCQLIMNAAFLLFFCYTRKPKINKKTVQATLILTQNIIFILTVIQTFEYHVSSTSYFWNIFGDFTSQFEIPPAYGGGGFRTKAMYHEPSHLALIIVFIFWMRILIEEKKITFDNIIKSSVIILLAKSSLGYLLFPLIIVLILRYYLIWYKKITIYLIIIALCIALIPAYYDQIFESTKIGQIQDTNTISSGYMRWGLPLTILGEHIKEGRITGYGLGQISTDYFWSISPMLRDAKVPDASIANGLMSAVIELGIFFILFLSYVFFYKFWTLNKNWQLFVLLNLIALTGSTYLMVQSYYTCFFLPILILKIIDNETKYNHSV